MRITIADDTNSIFLTGYSFRILVSSYFRSVYLWVSQCSCFGGSGCWELLHPQIRFVDGFVNHIYIRSVVVIDKLRIIIIIIITITITITITISTRWFKYDRD